MNPTGRDCPALDETSIPIGASPNSPAMAARIGAGRMHSWMWSTGETANRKGLIPYSSIHLPEPCCSQHAWQMAG